MASADHVLPAGNKVDTPPGQLSSVVSIMPPPINASVADVVDRRGSQAATEAALELPASVQEVHVGVHVGFAGAAPDGPRLSKVDCLHPRPDSAQVTNTPRRRGASVVALLHCDITPEVPWCRRRVHHNHVGLG